MAYHWTKSKYRKTHGIMFGALMLGILLIVVLINLLVHYFGDNFVTITLSMFAVFYWFGFIFGLSLYLTGESLTRYGGLHIERKRKGEGTVLQVAIKAAKTSIIAALFFALVIKLITG